MGFINKLFGGDKEVKEEKLLPWKHLNDIKSLDAIEEQILNPILDQPNIKINKNYQEDQDPIKWIEELIFEDIEIINYTSAKSIKAKMLT